MNSQNFSPTGWWSYEVQAATASKPDHAFTMTASARCSTVDQCREHARTRVTALGARMVSFRCWPVKIGEKVDAKPRLTPAKGVTVPCTYKAVTSETAPATPPPAPVSALPPPPPAPTTLESLTTHIVVVADADKGKMFPTYYATINSDEEYSKWLS